MATASAGACYLRSVCLVSEEASRRSWLSAHMPRHCFSSANCDLAVPQCASSLSSRSSLHSFLSPTQISEATANVGGALIELRRIEAMREIAGTLAKSRNVAYLPPGNQMLLGIGAGGQ